jgi:hypothetical protein
MEVVMGERAIEVTETYRPRSRGRRRAVTIERIPAIELTYEGETEIGFEFDVVGRIETLLRRALRSNDADEQIITYSQPRRSVPATHARRARRKQP